MTTKQQLREEIEKLRTELIRSRIDLQAVAPKRTWEGSQTRLTNFIHWERRPSEIHKFKTKLNAARRNIIIKAAPIVEFDPKTLKTAQRNVIRRKLRKMAKEPDIAAAQQPHEHYGMIYGIVARCKRGNFIYDSNHRACINLLAGRKHKAHYIDLRDIDKLIERLKHDYDREGRRRTTRGS